MGERPCRPEIGEMITPAQMALFVEALRNAQGQEYAEVTLVVKFGKIRFVELKTSATVREVE